VQTAKCGMRGSGSSLVQWHDCSLVTIFYDYYGAYAFANILVVSIPCFVEEIAVDRIGGIYDGSSSDFSTGY